MEQTKFCQCCAMPLTTETMGTNADKTPNEDYCCYCYQDGKFTFNGSMEQMIEFCVPHMAQANPGMAEDEARKQMQEFFPTLKRWHQA